jgi:hypothetical protein
VAHHILSAIGIYLAIGAVVALVMIAALGRIDPGARGVYGFRLLIAPGLALLWPVAVWCALRALDRLPGRAP